MKFAKNALLALTMFASLGHAAAQADPLGGAKQQTTSVVAGGTDTYRLMLMGGEDTIIRVRGDGDTDLDLLVYDENGNLVASDVNLGDSCTVHMRPRWTGPFIIKVVNRGSVYNAYTIWAY
jgi:hypothetical protein